MVLMLVPWAGAQSYTVTPLGTLGGIFSNVNAINDHDQITGYASLSDGVEHAFLWTSAQGMRDLGTLGGSTSYGFGLNNLGQVVGGSFPASENFYHAFVWTENNGMHDLGTLGGNYSYAEAINDSGEVVGYAYLPGDDSYHAFYWTAAEGLQDMGTLGGSESDAYSITESGQVVGSSTLADNVTMHAFLWTKTGGMQDLGTLGGQNSFAYAVSETGEVVGFADTPLGNQTAFSWTQLHGMQSIGAGPASYAVALNASNYVVGGFGPHSGQAFLWTPTSHIENLNNLIPPSSGWTLNVATGISQDGEIVVNGTVKATSFNQAAFLTPTN
jgi:probable HAF family extracellular repeat protein